MLNLPYLLLATCVALTVGMHGGMELTMKIDFIVYFLTGEKSDAYYNFNDTTINPSTKWVYCMGILYDTLTVVTADLCNVEADGMHWATGIDTDLDQIHNLKSVIHGHHPLDFRIVEVKNTSVIKWGPLGVPLLIIRLSEAQLSKMAAEGDKGIVTTVSKPIKIGAMMMVSMEECVDRYTKLLKAYSETTSVLPVMLPSSVFCAVESTEAFDPYAPSQPRFRRADDNTTITTSTEKPSETPTNGPKASPSSPISDGPVAPGLACPDSLGSPFIVKGGEILGILVAADCNKFNVSFFQSLANDFPTSDDEDYKEWKSRTYIASLTTRKIKKWTPRNPMIIGDTLRPVGWVPGPGLEPFAAAGSNYFTPSMFLISNGLTAYSLQTAAD